MCRIKLCSRKILSTATGLLVVHKRAWNAKECAKIVQISLERMLQEKCPTIEAVANISTQPTPVKAADAYSLMIQPPNASLDSHLRLGYDLKGVKSYR